MTASFRLVPGDRIDPPPDSDAAALGLAVIVPIMNEVGTIEELTLRIIEVCREHQLRLNEILFIDDRQVNVDAALAVGMRAHLFTDLAGLRPVVAQHLRWSRRQTGTRTSDRSV